MTMASLSHIVNAFNRKEFAISTIALDYPHSLPLRRSINIRWLIILVASLVLVANVVLVATSVSVNADNASNVAVNPVPVAPVTAQFQSLVTATLSPSPVVIAVPVATPPSQ